MNFIKVAASTRGTTTVKPARSCIDVGTIKRTAPKRFSKTANGVQTTQNNTGLSLSNGLKTTPRRLATIGSSGERRSGGVSNTASARKSTPISLIFKATAALFVNALGRSSVADGLSTMTTSVARATDGAETVFGGCFV